MLNNLLGVIDLKQAVNGKRWTHSSLTWTSMKLNWKNTHTHTNECAYIYVTYTYICMYIDIFTWKWMESSQRNVTNEVVIWLPNQSTILYIPACFPSQPPPNPIQSLLQSLRQWNGTSNIGKPMIYFYSLYYIKRNLNRKFCLYDHTHTHTRNYACSETTALWLVWNSFFFFNLTI